jgi:stage II sporulation protein AA (anti-sigma F factor antagonist)
MHLQETQVGTTLILEPDGHLDTAAAIPLEADVLQKIEDGARRILIDCSRMEYVNSSGLKVFLIAAKRLDTLGGKLAFCALAPNVQMIFDMIGFTKILSIFATREEALASLEEEAAVPRAEG